MVTTVVRAFTAAALATMLVTLSSCAGFEKGNGISRLDTESPEDKAEQKWFDNFYGQKNTNCDDSYWTTKPFCNP